MSATCPTTILDERIPCTLPIGHDGQHSGGGWVWWHGNGESCRDDACWMCDALHLPTTPP